MTLTTAQLERRKQGVGASEVPAILGLDRYRTPFDVWATKQPTFTPAPITDGPAYWGHLLEPVVADEYVRRHPDPIAAAVSDTLVGPEPWMLATPDRLIRRVDVELSWLLQIKTRSERSLHAQGWGEPGTDAVPDEVQAQVQWEMFVAGEERADVAVFLGDARRLCTYTLRRDDELIALLVEKVGAWWHAHVVAGEPPRIEGEHAAEYVRRRYPTATAEVRAAEGGELLLLEQYATWRAQQKEAEAQLAALAPSLQLAIGAAKGLEAPGVGRLLWVPQKGRATTDWDAIARAKGASDEDIQQHTRIGAPFRAMRFTPAKGED